MTETDRPEQPWLLPYENPLKRRFDAAFMKSIPQTPGVYFFRGEIGEVLYVGKAKSLRARLRSYRQARPHSVSRKVIRMLNLARTISWEECASEKDALLLENKLLRDLKPPFNVVNTSPESYYFIAIRSQGGETRFRLTLNPKPDGDLLYGAYKGRSLIRDGYAAMLRLLWLASREAGRFEYPPRLFGHRVPYVYSVPMDEAWLPRLKRFLAGRDRGFLHAVTERLLAREDTEVPRFVYHVIEEDLATCAELFERCFRRNRELKRHHGHAARLVAQEAVDDLLVLEGVRLGRVSSKSD